MESIDPSSSLTSESKKLNKRSICNDFATNSSDTSSADIASKSFSHDKTYNNRFSKFSNFSDAYANSRSTLVNISMETPISPMSLESEVIPS
ncbi:hypothetical protein HanRHA438_Chr16g0783301 [Helianthus annuus]|nr:hypothetical protein HanRHA438_Chr16g0783301 [Helianthus annuus]